MVIYSIFDIFLEIKQLAKIWSWSQWLDSAAAWPDPIPGDFPAGQEHRQPIGENRGQDCVWTHRFEPPQ
jgi:hypothetical protein